MLLYIPIIHQTKCMSITSIQDAARLRHERNAISHVPPRHEHPCMNVMENATRTIPSTACRRHHLQELRSTLQNGELLRACNVFTGNYTPTTFGAFALHYYNTQKTRGTKMSSMSESQHAHHTTHEAKLAFEEALYSVTGMPREPRMITLLLVQPATNHVQLTDMYSQWCRLLPAWLQCAAQCNTVSQKRALDICRKGGNALLVVNGFSILHRCFEPYAQQIICMQTEDLMGAFDATKVMRMLSSVRTRCKVVLDWNPDHINVLRTQQGRCKEFLFPTKFAFNPTKFSNARPLATRATRAVQVTAMFHKASRSCPLSPHLVTLANNIKTFCQERHIDHKVGHFIFSQQQNILRSAEIVVLTHAYMDDTGLPLSQLSHIANINPRAIIIADKCSLPTNTTLPWQNAIHFTTDIMSTLTQLCANTSRAAQLRRKFSDRAFLFWKHIHSLSSVELLRAYGTDSPPHISYLMK